MQLTQKWGVRQNGGLFRNCLQVGIAQYQKFFHFLHIFCYFEITILNSPELAQSLVEKY